jgi:putative tryptophan/tyrosine transport system substrate-binding protein
MGNVGNREAMLEMGNVEAAARTLSLEIAPLEIRRAEDIAPAFEALKAPVDALYVVQDGFVTANRTRIITLTLSARLPTIFETREHVEAGALMSYGPSFSDLFRRAAEYVDKILQGPNRATSRSNSRPSSSPPSTLRQRKRWGSPFQKHCSPAPTR